MAGKLKKQEESQTLTFEVFDLELDDDDRQRLSDDPRGFLTNLLIEEGQTVNDLLVTSDVAKFLDPYGSSGVNASPRTSSIWHCTEPRSLRSKWITIIMGAPDQG
jgi:hypothetical protein